MPTHLQGRQVLDGLFVFVCDLDSDLVAENIDTVVQELKAFGAKLVLLGTRPQVMIFEDLENFVHWFPVIFDAPPCVYNNVVYVNRNVGTDDILQCRLDVLLPVVRTITKSQLLLFSLLAKGSNNAEALCVVFFYRQLM
jgi:hypothetical protein